jgi:hypothetical protein
MNNLSSIHHKNFDKVYELTQNYNKAVFLDKCIFWFQISKYTLDDDRIWFTRSIAVMAKELNYSARSVSRYLKEFAELGYIEKINKLCYKKNLYIRITEKLIQLITPKLEYGRINKSSPNLTPNANESHKSVFLEQNGVIEKDNLAFSLYKDKDINSFVNNTTVSVASFVDKKEKPTQSQFPTYAIEEHIGECITVREKNYIKGVMNQIILQDKTLISNPNQLFAEIVFSVTNENQIKGITNFNHRIQIISKLVRTRRWSTPKGFANHSEYGRLFKNQEFKQKKNLSSTNTPISTILEIKNKIKQYKNKLRELIIDVTSDNSLLKETHHRQRAGAKGLESLLQSIYINLDKKQNEILICNTKLEALAAKLPKDRHSISMTIPLKSNWDQYEALCQKQRIIEEELNTAEIAYEKTLQENSNQKSIQEVTDNYLNSRKRYELLNEELFQLGELLNQKHHA